MRKLASHFLARKPFTSAQACPATILGVLGVLSVLARPPEDEIPSGRHAHPQWHSLWPAATDWARRHLAAHAWELLLPMFRHSANFDFRLVFGRGMGYNPDALATQGLGQDRLPAQRYGHASRVTVRRRVWVASE